MKKVIVIDGKLEDLSIVVRTEKEVKEAVKFFKQYRPYIRFHDKHHTNFQLFTCVALISDYIYFGSRPLMYEWSEIKHSTVLFLK